MKLENFRLYKWSEMIKQIVTLFPHFLKKEKMEGPLSQVRLQQPLATINRLHAFLHASALLALLYYRATTILALPPAVTLAHALVSASETLFAFLWLLGQAFRWRPVIRTVFPERLPPDGELPEIDVFICTADPEMEPPVDVMSTVISAMALDYPPEKLVVYLSDDAGADISVYAMKEAFSFARSWVPFCRKHGVFTRNPDAYFSGNIIASEEEKKMKKMYEEFKESVKRAAGIDKKAQGSAMDRPPLIQIISEREEEKDEKETTMPMLVYVSREKRKGIPHHFKAGALNVLLRVSGILSNAPYILVLDCDMYANDPTSARKAMCFHLDPKLSHSLAFVQFPQAFHNISADDIYGGSLRLLFKTLWKGCDGLNGPIVSGSGFYIKRKALLNTTPSNSLEKGDVIQYKTSLGPSNLLIMSMKEDSRKGIYGITLKETILNEGHILASSAYENDTNWGKEIGFLYDSVVEDFITSLHIHSRGWKSVYLDPSVPAFLGSTPTNLGDSLLQSKRWGAGLLQVGFSRYHPLTYCMCMSKTSILQRMCYAYLAFSPLDSIFIVCYAIIPPICLLRGISVFPQVSSPWVLLFLAIYLSYLGQYLLGDHLSSGRSFKQWWNAEKIWMMKSSSSRFFATLSVVMKFIGIKEVDFELTSKVNDDEQLERYEKGIFDFQGVGLLVVPLMTIVIVNMVCFIGGVGRTIYEGSYDAMFGQICLTAYTITWCYAIIEGATIRKGRARISTSITLLSLIISIIILSLGYFAFLL